MANEYLLDTCTLLWLQLEPSRIPWSLRQILLPSETRVLVSAATIWEVAIKWSKGKLFLPSTPDEFLAKAKIESILEILPVSEPEALMVGRLPHLHGDPFDRIQIAQAIEYGLILATPDPLIRQYAVRTIWE